MTFEEFKDRLFALAKKNGVEVQISFLETKEFSLRLANGDLDQYTDAGKFNVEIKVLKDGKQERSEHRFWKIQKSVSKRH